MQINIDRDLKRHLDHLSEVTGEPKWVIIEAAIKAATYGPDGLPVGWGLKRRDETQDSLLGGQDQLSA